MDSDYFCTQLTVQSEYYYCTFISDVFALQPHDRTADEPQRALSDGPHTPSQFDSLSGQGMPSALQIAIFELIPMGIHIPGMWSLVVEADSRRAPAGRVSLAGGALLESAEGMLHVQLDPLRKQPAFVSKMFEFSFDFSDFSRNETIGGFLSYL